MSVIAFLGLMQPLSIHVEVPPARLGEHACDDGVLGNVYRRVALERDFNARRFVSVLAVVVFDVIAKRHAAPIHAGFTPEAE